MNTKQWNALLVAALFVLSIVPFALADDNGSDQGTVDAGTDVSVTASVNASDNGSGHQTREQMKERLQQAKDKIDQTRERMMNAHENILKARLGFMEARDRLHAKNATADDKQQFLLSASDKVLELLNTLKSKVEASNSTDSQELADINAAIDQMTTAQATIQGLDLSTASKDDIRAAAKQLEDAWKNAREVLKEGAGKHINHRVGLIAEQMSHLSAKLDTILSRLSAKGYDVSVATDLKAQFDVKLSSAQSHFDKATSLFDSKDVQGANTEVRAALSDLKDARDLLKQIVQSIRKTTKPGELESVEHDSAGQNTTEHNDVKENETASGDNEETATNDASENETDSGDTEDTSVNATADAQGEANASE
jgi:hypothetical protein